MPLNHTLSERRLSDCDAKLSALFADTDISEALQKHIKAVQEYYNTSYVKAKKNKTVEEIIVSYEFYVEQLSKIKSGELPHPDMLDAINHANDARRIDVILANLAKTAELIFWASTVGTLFTSIFLIALPMLLLQTPVGILVSLTMGGLLIATTVNSIKCLTEFRSFGRHDDEYRHETSLLSFFKPASNHHPIPEEMTEEVSCCF